MVRRFIFALVRESEWIDIDVPVVACRDPKDDRFLSLAVNGHATHIVTGDSDLLVLDPFQNVHILEPRALIGRAGT
jgi:putative PIN family toxin of toxin-antitoxin system